MIFTVNCPNFTSPYLLRVGTFNKKMARVSWPSLGTVQLREGSFTALVTSETVRCILVTLSCCRLLLLDTSLWFYSN